MTIQTPVRNVPTVRYVEHVMNMPISLALRGQHADDDAGRRAWHRVMDELRETDRIFSTYREDSFISRLARDEITLAECPSRVREVVQLGQLAEIESGGAFSIWRSNTNGTLTLDPSGVVKGWSVQRAAEHLRVLARTDYCLSAGGDMVCRTLDPETAPWQIGIEDPFDPSRIRAVVPISNGAVATSGTAHRGHHITDARANKVPNRIGSVTVTAGDLTWADIDATAAYALDTEASQWLRVRSGRSALIVWSDGTDEIIPASGLSDTVTLTCPNRRRESKRLPHNLRVNPPSSSKALLAVAVGFEPTVGLTPHIISSDAPSAARTRHRNEGT